ncbi:hypothetical protein B0H21DRAFT_847298 [Amylocystis lapponica]|nr:hypothetical protein B0H21DRAFT_847298 [Amylocystis lapponica]
MSYSSFDSLPVELVADILGELDIATLVTASYLCRRLHAISSDSSLNPWRRPILRTLRNTNGLYDPYLKHLSVRSTVPRQNFVEILSIARAEYILFEASLPNLKDTEWEDCFRRRFLPGWTKAKKDISWKGAFLKVLHRIWHRTHSSCTSDEAWTKYVVLNRNGTANQLDGASRNLSPLLIFEQLKLQNNLSHLVTRIRVLVEFADVRIIALGVLNKPRTAFTVNNNARALLHPPFIEKPDNLDAETEDTSDVSDIATIDDATSGTSEGRTQVQNSSLNQIYRRLLHPLPAWSHECYPFYTRGGEDKRWLGTGGVEEQGMQWVGTLMLIAQLVGPHTKERFIEGPALQDRDLVVGGGRSQYASFTFEDLGAIAPWLEITNHIEGAGLGH